ncbi:MAG: thermonuclease family protein [Xanthobacter sp.]
MSFHFHPFLLLATALALLASGLGVRVAAQDFEPDQLDRIIMSACHQSSPPGPDVSIKRLGEDGSLLLTNGQSFLPEGISIPSRLTPDARMVDTARVTVSSTLQGQVMRLTESRTDRYGRLNGQAVFESGEDVTMVLLRAGAGTVRPVETHPPRTRHRRRANAACNKARLDSENKARQAGKGIWAHSNVIINAQNDVALAAHAGLFTLVEGQVRAVGVTRNRIYINFGPRWSEDFTIMLARKDFATIFGDDLDPAMLRGTFMRVRGVVQEEGGPAIFIHKAEDVAW